MSANFDEVIIDIEKIRDYCLNLDHTVGKHKAVVFKNKLGFTSDNAEELKKLILKKIKFSQAQRSLSDEYGERYYIDIIITRFDNTETVRTLWILKRNESVPRFVSCYIKN